MTYKQFLAQCKLKAAAYDLCITNNDYVTGTGLSTLSLVELSTTPSP
ncbi:hypothetical protein [Pelosinus baikalensis]|uniref:Uncharacterized protein n=1 Tax=Pelosinus baikalensis TaxID=2892015 RepID=A0ABS8HXR4_9FIRM|nr:hypothetical protein [Pelosinus baikalensis]MCC5467959.1 hypothetical protein [Pelosinus baikalensis]